MKLVQVARQLSRSAPAELQILLVAGPDLHRREHPVVDGNIRAGETERADVHCDPLTALIAGNTGVTKTRYRVRPAERA